MTYDNPQYAPNSNYGCINSWHCDSCGKNTVAIHVANGVTPFLLTCRETKDCNEMAWSAFYPSGPVPKEVMLQLGWEWYKPSAAEAKECSKEVREYINQGGLLLRELTDQGRAIVVFKDKEA